MKKIHFILQGKGGVGKSVVASMLAQFLIEKKLDPFLLDTDPVNNSFFNVSSLKVKLLDIGGKDNKPIEQRKFDKLIHTIISEESEHFVIDNGASSFIAFSNYFVVNNLAKVFESFNAKVVIHMIVTGGSAYKDTMQGMNAMLMQYPSSCSFILWMNHFFGDLLASDGKSFLQSDFFRSVQRRINGLIELPHYDGDLFSDDFSKLLKEHLTFNDVLDCVEDEYDFMFIHRISRVKEDVFSAIESGLLNANLIQLDDASIQNESS